MVDTRTLGASFLAAPALAAMALFGSATLVDAQGVGPDFADMVEQVLPAVVHVSVETRPTGVLNPDQGMPGSPGPFSFDPFEQFRDRDGLRPDPRDFPRAIMGSGSGFIVDETGYVVTNNHVVAGATVVSVTLSDGESYDASIVGADVSTDLAVLKIDGDGPFPTVDFGDSDTLRIGNWVVAAGGPFGLSGTVTAGIVSATGRDLRSGPYDDYIQFDASINPGNSGGPVFDTSGRVVGVSTAIVSPSRGSVGIGFAVPAAIAKPVIESLMADGMVERGFLGVQIQHVSDELAEALGLDEAYGALVAEVRPDTPAELAGVRVGDLIASFDGQRVEQMRDLPRLVAATEPGSEVEIELLRDGDTIALAVTVGELAAAGQLAAIEPSDPPTMALDRLGLGVVSAADYGWRGEDGEPHGVIVTDVQRGSPAEMSDLEVGDLILAVGGRSIDSVAELGAIIDEMADSDEAMVALLVERDGERRFVALPVAGS